VSEHQTSNYANQHEAVHEERTKNGGRGVSFSMQATRKGLSCNLALLLTVVLLVGGSLVIGKLFSNGFALLPLGHGGGTSSSSGGQGVTATAAAIAPTPSPGQLVLSDPLQNNSKGYQWDERAGCQFTGGAYDVQVAQPNTSQPCYAHTTSFSNFTFEVQMRIVQGDCGAIIFRADSATNNFYGFRICQDGHYSFVGRIGSHSATIIYQTTSAIHKGLNQINTLAVVAHRNMFDLYVNYQKVDSVSDSTYSQGEIGVLAANQSGNGTEVVFSDAHVWVGT
jgi:hypothetical protein